MNGHHRFQSYDEGPIAARLTRSTHQQRAFFAAACAEVLFESLVTAFGADRAEAVEHCREALTLAWQPVGSTPLEELSAVLERTVAYVPHDDTPGWEAAPIAANAVAATYYALRVQRSGSVQDAVWSARQIVEAADYIMGASVGAGALRGHRSESPSLEDLALAEISRLLDSIPIVESRVGESVLDARAAGIEFRNHWASVT